MGIPKEEQVGAVAHLDTNLLRGAVDYEDARETREAARGLVNRKNATFRTCASLPALGELVMVMARDLDSSRFQAAMGRLHDLIRTGRLRLFGLDHKNQRAAAIAQEIAKADSRIGAADALILACAFADPQAAVLYSTDRFVGWREVEALARAWETRVLAPP